MSATLVAFLALAASAAEPSASKAAPPVPRVTRGALTTELVPEVPEVLSQRLEPYLNVRRADLAGWDSAQSGPVIGGVNPPAGATAPLYASGPGLYTLTRFGNVVQVHRVERPLGMRRQLTFVSEGVDGFAPSTDPKRPGGIVVMDTGGSENSQLLWLDAKGTPLTLLTDGKSKNDAPLWSDDGSKVAFSSTRRNGKDFDLWILDPRDPKKPHELIYEASGQWVPLHWSASGEQLLVLHDVSETKKELFVLTPGQGLGARIDPQPGVDVAFDGAVFAADGVYYLSDAGGEHRGLWRHDLRSGKDSLLSGDIPWDFESIAISRDRKLLALTLNEKGWSRLRLFDTVTKKFRADPKLPPAIINRLEFSRDGKRLALSIEGGREVGDLHVLELGSGKLERWTESEMGGLDRDKVHVPELIEFRSFDGRMIPAFVLKPDGPGPHPVVVSIHGGPEAQTRPYFSSFYETLVTEGGFAVVLPNVRGSTGYGRSYTLMDNGDKREDSVKDIGALLDWIATQPDLRKDKVAVYGGSYGGYMVLATGAMFPERISAIVDVVGISNFVTFLESTKEYRRDLRRVEYGDERNPEMRKFLDRISPTNNAHKIQSPLFVVQGANDPRVPLSEAEQIVAKVRAQGREVWYMVAADEGHGFQKKDNRDAFVKATLMFLQKHLK